MKADRGTTEIILTKAYKVKHIRTSNSHYVIASVLCEAISCYAGIAVNKDSLNNQAPSQLQLSSHKFNHFVMFVIVSSIILNKLLLLPLWIIYES